MDDRGQWLRELARSGDIAAEQPLRICLLCAEMLDVSGAGISMVTDSGNRGMVCSSDDTAGRIEDLQFTLGEGPCVDAVRSRSPVLIPDLSDRSDIDASRWPGFLDAAEGLGVRALFAFPLRIGAIGVGAIDLYRDAPGELTAEELSAAVGAADVAAVALLNLDHQTEDVFVDDVSIGASYRMQVHQATGMIMAQLGVTVEQAFLLLRARAFATDRSLADLANDVVGRRVRFTPEDI